MVMALAAPRAAPAGTPTAVNDAAPLRVAIVTETYPPEVNGVATTIERALHGLVARGLDVQLVRLRRAGEADATGQGAAGPPRRLLLPSLPIPRYPQLRLGLPATAALAAAWRSQRPGVVHIVTEGPLGWSALRAADQLGLPTVSEFRTNFHAYSAHYRVGWLRQPLMAYLRWFHNRTGATMVPTEALRSELTASGFERLRVVARGVDTRRFAPVWRSASLRVHWGAGPNDMVALYVGRLAPEKNLDTLVEAVRQMRADDPALRLVFVGDGPGRARLQRQCPDAVFAGERRGDELAEHYASADVFLFPSVTETFGNVVPEAMASGLAVVAFDHAAAGQLVRHGESGLLAAVGADDTFCTLARRLAGDLPQARALGAQARQQAMALDWEHIVDQIVAAYGEAIAGMAVPAAATAALGPPEVRQAEDDQSLERNPA